MKKITFYCLLVLLSIITETAAQCTNGTAYSSNIYTPIYDNNEYAINGNAYTGKYRLINTLSTAVIYNFRSSVTTDYITITDANGIQVFASGLSGSNGINFTPPYPQVVRFYVHLNAQCEADPVINSRSNYLKTTIVTYPCDSPSNLSVSNITSNSAKVNWNEPVIGTNFSYEIYANTTGIAPTANTNPTQLESVGTTAQLAGLTSNSTYYYWVRNDCVADAGIWVPGGSFTTTASSGCNSATYGLNPENTFTMLCNGTVQQIANNIFAGSYSNVYINNGQQYTFSSSVATDFITITDPTGATVYASGQTPLVWISNSSGNIRYYLHSNANCGSESIARVKSIKCGGDVTGGCTDGNLHPANTYTPTCTGSLELIANDSWAGEYANINVTTNRNYTFSTSAVSDYISIVNPTGNIVLATGASPLTWNSGNISGVIRYFIHSNSNCGTQNINRQRYIQCTASTTCGLPSNTTIYNLGATSCLIGWTAPTPTPSSGYEVYLSTSSVTPVVNATPTYTSNSTSVNISSGLTPATSYYVWVRSNCGATKSNWTPAVNFVTNALTGCTTAEHGLFPATTFVPSCSGTLETIASNAWAGEYSNINVNANHQYTFSSSVTTDVITITTVANVILASGTSPLSWSSGSTSGVIRYYLHANALCQSQNTNRIRYIQCVALQSCGLPSALAVSNITSNSCRLTWNAPTPVATSYDIFVSTTNTAPVVSTTATQTSNGNIVGSLNGLSASTTYYYWVRSNCSGTKSAWVSGGSFTTIAALNCNGAIYGLYPEATFMPTCSPSSEPIATDAWAGEYSNVNVSSNHQYTFTSSIATDYITITNTSGTAVLASGTSPLVWNSGATAGVVRYHLNTNVNCGVQNSGRTKFIQCTAVSTTCGVPTALSVTNITSDSCRLNWTAPATTPTSYEVYIITTNTAPTTSTTATATTTSAGAGVLNGLSVATTYYYWVRSVCGSTKSNWVSGGSFMTNASLNCNGAIHGLYPNATFTPSCTGAAEQIATDSWAGEYTNVNILSNKQYTFTSSIATDYITITNAAGTQVLASGLSPLSWSSGTNSGLIRYHLNTNANCGTQNTTRIRSIQCVSTSSCNAPTQLWSDGVTSTTANIGWIPSTSAPNGGYLYVYNTTPTIGGMDGNTSTTSATLTNLQPNTTYYWWVAADCVSSQSNWVLGGSFTTLAGTTSCWQSVATGMIHSVAIKADGTLWAWGSNDFGQLGDGTTVAKNTPVQIGTANDWQSVSAGTLHTMAIKTNGTLWGWGINGNSRLGDGTTVDKIVPTQIGSATNWQRVCAGDVLSMAIKTNGTLWAWGYNGYAQFGDGTMINRSTPYQIGTATNWQSVDLGNLHTVAIKTNGTLWAWGTNTYGQIGDGTTAVRLSPVQIGTATDWHSVAAGANHSVGLKTNGLLSTWGHNNNGQLGDGTNVSKLVPTGIFDQVQNISAGANYTAGTTTYGNMWVTGNNNFGQLGDGTTVNKNTIQVTNSNNHQMITAGMQHTISLNTDGSLTASGSNDWGQLGNGSTVNSLSFLSIACPTSLNIDDFSNTNTAIKVYPNPVNDILNISFEQGITSLSIYNLLGQEVLTKVVNADEVTLNISNFATGTYLVKVNAGNELKTVKIIKL